MILRPLLLALSRRSGIGDALERLPVTRRLVRRFVAGRTTADAFGVLAALNGQGIETLITYLGEHVATTAEAERATAVYVGLLDEMARRGLRGEPSLKLTHLGLDASASACRTNLARVLARAREHGRRVWIDMESSAYTDRTLDLYADLRGEFANAACVLQAYLRRTERDVERLVALGASVRLCKGAYDEPASIAYADKRDVDANYARLADRLLASDAVGRVYAAFATHDERLIAHVRGRAAERRVDPARFEIQMLYGVRADLLGPLVRAGLTVRVYVPYGEAWYAYFVRRLAERPANLVFLLKNLLPRRGG